MNSVAARRDRSVLLILLFLTTPFLPLSFLFSGENEDYQVILGRTIKGHFSLASTHGQEGEAARPDGEW